MIPVMLAAFTRSPFTFANKGALAIKRPDDIAAEVVKGMVKREDFDPASIEDLILGCAFPEGEQGFNMARLVGLMAGLPETVAGVTVNRFCGSSMQAIHMAAGAIQLGAGEAFICAGVESMSRVPMGGFNPMPNPDLYENNDGAYMPMGETAENLAEKYQISREEQESFALNSQSKASEAQSKGKFKSEIVPIETQDGIVKEDSCLRPDTSLEGLSGLEPAFDADGTVTAGTSSPLTDGAAAVLVCTESFAHNHNVKPMALLKSIAVSGVSPEIMGIGPVLATQKALERANLKIEDLDVIELNEAFAVVVLRYMEHMGIDHSDINVNGGEIAMGHPLGATGAMILGTVLDELERSNKSTALATLCVGGGMGTATVIERV